jgi:sugar phosphate isomerase/epimerase
MSRRAFLQTSALGSVALAAGLAEGETKASAWSIGCFNRPWMQKFGSKRQSIDTTQPANWGFEVALKGIHQAGYKTVGLLTPMPDDPFLAADAPEEYLSGLKEKIAAAGLRATMGSLRVKPELDLAEAIQNTRKQIDHARFLKLEWLLTFGVDDRKYYDKYNQMMTDAADYAQDAGIKLVMKPHGGSSGTAEEIQRCLKAVARPNFKIWYDAGNIVYYDGRDPVEELKPIVQYVTGFCAKDCDHKRGQVMIPFGAGTVDFAGVFKVLKGAGFDGPIFVECAGGKTFDEVTDGARANRVFLEKVLAAI